MQTLLRTIVRRTLHKKMMEYIAKTMYWTDSLNTTTLYQQGYTTMKKCIWCILKHAHTRNWVKYRLTDSDKNIHPSDNTPIGRMLRYYMPYNDHAYWPDPLLHLFTLEYKMDNPTVRHKKGQKKMDLPTITFLTPNMAPAGLAKAPIRYIAFKICIDIDYVLSTWTTRSMYYIHTLTNERCTLIKYESIDKRRTQNNFTANYDHGLSNDDCCIKHELELNIFQMFPLRPKGSYLMYIGRQPLHTLNDVYKAADADDGYCQSKDALYRAYKKYIRVYNEIHNQENRINYDMDYDPDWTYYIMKEMNAIATAGNVWEDETN